MVFLWHCRKICNHGRKSCKWDACSFFYYAYSFSTKLEKELKRMREKGSRMVLADFYHAFRSFYHACIFSTMLACFLWSQSKSYKHRETSVSKMLADFNMASSKNFIRDDACGNMYHTWISKEGWLLLHRLLLDKLICLGRQYFCMLILIKHWIQLF